MLIMCVRCSRSISSSLKHNHRFLLFLPPFSPSPNRIHPHCCYPTSPLISSDSPSLPISCFYRHKEHIVSCSIKVNLFSLAGARPGQGPSELVYLCFPAGIKVAPWLYPIFLLKLQCIGNLLYSTNMCIHWRFQFLLLFPYLIITVLNAEVEKDTVNFLSFFVSFFLSFCLHSSKSQTHSHTDTHCKISHTNTPVTPYKSRQTLNKILWCFIIILCTHTHTYTLHIHQHISKQKNVLIGWF